MATSLQIFIQVAEQGEWDRLTETSGQLLQELTIAGKPGSISRIPDAERKEIENTILLLQTALEKCLERKAQIAPLINGFAPQTPPEAP